jgi:L-alanine-DL-glutamate epimerase-like enolase superfamily enzyme
MAARLPLHVRQRRAQYVPQLDAITETGMTMREGRAYPSAEPGLGIAWDWAAIDRMLDGASRSVR